jgi:hypothetical protein
MQHDVATAAPWRPIVYIAIADDRCRERVADTLQRLGWCVIEQPSGFHVLSAIADVIEHRSAAARPGLLVVDEFARGCSGATLARGLVELGCSIPTVLVRDPWLPAARGSYGVGIHVVDRQKAPSAIAAIVEPWSPVSLMQPIWSRERATA